MSHRTSNTEDKKTSWARRARQVLVAAFCLVLLSMAAADPGVGKLTVTATVRKHASMKVVMQPTSVLVTADDVARGFVDVPASVQLVVRSNSPGGYLLDFGSNDNFLHQIRVTGLDRDVQLGSAGGAVAQAALGPGMKSAVLTLGFRFVLSRTAQQGIYAWPLALTVASL
jgi:hypothetical protein